MQLRKRVKDVERLKEEGNSSFKSGALDDAVDKYTAAIEVKHFAIEYETTTYRTDSYHSELGGRRRRERAARYVRRSCQTGQPH